MFKILCLVLLVGVVGCVKLPNFPTFFSHQDLRDQEREIDSSFKKDQIIMAKNQKHFLPDGREHKGATHKDKEGKLMSGKTHTKSSKYLKHTRPKGTA